MWLEFIDRLRLWVMCTKGIPLRYVQDQICPGLNANEVQIPCDKQSVLIVLIGKKSPKHTQFSQL